MDDSTLESVESTLADEGLQGEVFNRGETMATAAEVRPLLVSKATPKLSQYPMLLALLAVATVGWVVLRW